MLVPEGLLMELGPAPGANWNFVLGHLQPVLGEHEPVSFLALSGAVLSLLKTIIGAGAELFGFRSGREHVGVVVPISPPSSAKPGEIKTFPPAKGQPGCSTFVPLCALVCRPAGSSCCTMRCGRRTNDPRRTRSRDRHPKRHGAGYRVLRRGNALARASALVRSLG